MGGNVALTIREPDGTEHRIGTWNKCISSYLQNVRLYDKDLGAAKKVFEFWDLLQMEYVAKSRFKRSDQNPRPFAYLAPDGLGLVVVDMVNNQILEHTDAVRTCTMDGIAIRHEMNCNADGSPRGMQIGTRREPPKKMGMKAFEIEDEFCYARRFKRLWENGKITQVVTTPEEIPVQLAGKPLEEIVGILQTDIDAYFPIDTSPFKVTSYREFDPIDAMAMKATILELGFKLTDQEKQLWEEWIEENTRHGE